MATFWKGTQFMTEKAGGSDVGRVETTARQADGDWRVWGEKWFCSHTDADVALMLARPEGAPAGTKGLALFALPRRLQDGRATATGSCGSRTSSARARWRRARSCSTAPWPIRSGGSTAASSR